MTRKQINLVLWSVSAASFAGAIIWAALAVLLPLESIGRTHEVATASGAPAGKPPIALTDLNTFQPAWDKTLRASLAESASEQQSDSGPAPSSVTIESGGPLILVGTIGDALVLIRTADGTTSVHQVGDQIAGAQILAIRPGRVDIRIDGRTMTIAKIKETAILPISPAEPGGAVVSSPGR